MIIGCFFLYQFWWNLIRYVVNLNQEEKMSSKLGNIKHLSVETTFDLCQALCHWGHQNSIMTVPRSACWSAGLPAAACPRCEPPGTGLSPWSSLPRSHNRSRTWEPHGFLWTGSSRSPGDNERVYEKGGADGVEDDWILEEKLPEGWWELWKRLRMFHCLLFFYMNFSFLF